MAKIDVKGTSITVYSEGDKDFFISDWLRNRNTVEFIGIWEQVHNPDFNYGGFAAIKTQAGLNLIYASEADLLNMVLFGKTAKQWRDEILGNRVTMSFCAKRSVSPCAKLSPSPCAKLSPSPCAKLSPSPCAQSQGPESFLASAQ